MATDRGQKKRVSFTLAVYFESEVAKESSAEDLTTSRELLAPRGAPELALDNLHYLLVLVDGAFSHRGLPTNASETADAGSHAGVGYSLLAGWLVD